MNAEEQLNQVLSRLDELSKEHHEFVEKTKAEFQETRRERRERRWGPWAMVIVLWVAGLLLVGSTLSDLGEIQADAWATVTLRTIVFVAAVVCMTAVNVTSLRKDL